jgi:hypothetical protein
LRAIQKSNHTVSSRKATNHSRPCDKPGLSKMRKGKSQEKDGSPYSWLKERSMKHYLTNSEQLGFF